MLLTEAPGHETDFPLIKPDNDERYRRPCDKRQDKIDEGPRMCEGRALCRAIDPLIESACPG